MLSIRRQVAELLLKTFPEDFQWKLIRFSGRDTFASTCFAANTAISSQIYICDNRLGINCGSRTPGKKQDWVNVVFPLDYETDYKVFEARLRTLMLVLPEDINVRNALLQVDKSITHTKQFLEKEET